VSAFAPLPLANEVVCVSSDDGFSATAPHNRTKSSEFCETGSVSCSTAKHRREDVDWSCVEGNEVMVGGAHPRIMSFGDSVSRMHSPEAELLSISWAQTGGVVYASSTSAAISTMSFARSMVMQRRKAEKSKCRAHSVRPHSKVRPARIVKSRKLNTSVPTVIDGAADVIVTS